MPTVPGLQVQRGGGPYRRFSRKRQVLWRARADKTSPALELSVFGSFSGVSPGDTINAVTLTVNQFASPR